MNNSATEHSEHYKVLLAGDASARPAGLEAALRQAGFRMLDPRDPASSQQADAILITLAALPDSALEPLLGDRDSLPPRIVLLDTREPGAAAAALAAGAVDALAAPVHLPELLSRVTLRIREARKAGRPRSEAPQRRAQDAVQAGRSTSLHSGSPGLTGSEALETRVREEFERARRYALSFSLVLLAVDELGTSEPAQASQLREEVAQALRRELRAPDLILPFSSREFAIVLPETGESGARQSVSRLRERLTRLPFEGDPRLEPTRFSAGIVTYPHPAAHQCTDLFAMAEAALMRGRAQAGERIGIAV